MNGAQPTTRFSSLAAHHLHTCNIFDTQLSFSTPTHSLLDSQPELASTRASLQKCITSWASTRLSRIHGQPPGEPHSALWASPSSQSFRISCCKCACLSLFCEWDGVEVNFRFGNSCWIKSIYPVRGFFLELDGWCCLTSRQMRTPMAHTASHL